MDDTQTTRKATPALTRRQLANIIAGKAQPTGHNLSGTGVADTARPKREGGASWN